MLLHPSGKLHSHKVFIPGVQEPTKYGRNTESVEKNKQQREPNTSGGKYMLVLVCLKHIVCLKNFEISDFENFQTYKLARGVISNLPSRQLARDICPLPGMLPVQRKCPIRLGFRHGVRDFEISLAFGHNKLFSLPYKHHPKLPHSQHYSKPSISTPCLLLPLLLKQSSKTSSR